MEPISIRKIGPAEVEDLKKISEQTFSEAFAAANTEQNMNWYFETAYAVDQLRSELMDLNSEFYFAEFNERVIGYLKLNFGIAQTELQEENGLEIQRIYVLQEFHGKKVGQLLFEKAVDIARSKSADYVWLGVWEHNPKAIRFYEKNGFVAFNEHTFRFGDEDQRDVMMKLVLD
jgi:ribosomal protein S18 acetylase RimI-like enzyme